MELHTPEPALLRRHVHALFATGDGLPGCVADQEQRFGRAVVEAGLGDRLCHVLSGVLDIRERAAEPFELFVLGEGKFGKSTLVNALLGCAVAPTDYIPKTWCFNRYVAEPSPPAYVRIFVSEELAARQACDHLLRRLGAPVGSYRSLLEYRLAHDDAEHLAADEETRVVRTLNQPDAYWSPVMEMEWAVPAETAMLPGIRLVDTMGINQIAAPMAHLHHLRWQYERADAVLWLVTADKLGAEATRAQIQEARRYAKVVYLLITRWDKVRDREAALARAQEHYGRMCTGVMPISALAALAANGGLRPQTPEERDFLTRHRNLSRTDLLDLSGFERLTGAFQQFLDGRHCAIRNAQVYSSLRQKDRELRRVAQEVGDEARQNMQLYAELRANVCEAGSSSTTDVASRMDGSVRRWLTEVGNGLSRVDYDNRHEARGLIGLDRIAGEFEELQRQLAQSAQRRFDDVVQWAMDPERAYRASEFGPTGAVAGVSMASGTTLTSVTIRPTSLSFVVQDPTGFWTEVKIFLANLFGAADEMKREAAGKFRSAARDAIDKELKGKAKQASKRLTDHVTAAQSQFLMDVDEQYSRTGGDAVHGETADRVDRVLARRVVEPLLVSIPVKLMRRYGWRR